MYVSNSYNPAQLWHNSYPVWEKNIGSIPAMPTLTYSYKGPDYSRCQKQLKLWPEPEEIKWQGPRWPFDRPPLVKVTVAQAFLNFIEWLKGDISYGRKRHNDAVPCGIK